jgi:N-acetylglucosaminyldiphosphoundecaprenol N-acetyl-beta-D-mannosaminyltransferase
MSRAQLAPHPAVLAPESAPGAEPRKRRDAASPWRDGARSRLFLGMRVDGTTYADAAGAILERAEQGEGGRVCVATVHMVMESCDDPRFRRLVNGAELVTPDGMPLVFGLRALGVSGATRVYGPALLGLLCRRAESAGLPVGFYGGRPEVLGELVRRTQARFPRLRIAFSASPPFRTLDPEEERAVVEAIEASGARLLFVGLGCPKQERWMAAHREALSCVLVGVGAAFDFLAGARAQAPAWLQRAGLEWLFRLACEPRRLWRRYLLGNPRFALHFARQLARHWAAALRARASSAPQRGADGVGS